MPRLLAIVLTTATLALLVAVAPSNAARPASGTVTLRDAKSGLSVRAPRGYRLSARGGVYTLAGGGNRARFFFGRSALGAGETGAQLAGAVGGKVTGVKTSATAYSATVIAPKRATTVRVSTAGEFLQVVLTTKASTRDRAGKLGPAQVSIGDVAQLVRIVGTRQGGTPVPLNTTIPTTRFAASDGGSSATVPTLPGWQWQGSQGGITGGHATQGFVALGQIGVVQNGSAPQYAFSPSFVGPDLVLRDIYPQYARLVSGAQVQFTNVQLVAGTEGILGPQTPNGIYQTALTINGRPYVGIFLVSSSDAAGLAPGLWYFYYSAVVLAADAPPSVGAALLDVWRTWDASGASAQRLQQTLATIASTRVPGAPIDPAVFQAAADKWGAYIRE